VKGKKGEGREDEESRGVRSTNNQKRGGTWPKEGGNSKRGKNLGFWPKKAGEVILPRRRER